MQFNSKIAIMLLLMRLLHIIHALLISSIATTVFAQSMPQTRNYHGYHAWIQPFYEYGKQNNTGSLLGYTAPIGGVTVGVDRSLNACNMLGLALSYSHSEISPILNSGNETQLNSYLATLYGFYNFDDLFDVKWRLVGGGNHSKMLQNSYDGQQFSGKAIASNTYHYRSVCILPKISAEYTYLQQQVLINQVQNANAFTLGVGAQLARRYTKTNYAISSEVHAIGYYDVISGNLTTSPALIMGGPAIATTSHPAKASGDFGASMDFYINDQMRLTAEYDLQARLWYFNNVIYLKFNYIF